MTTDLSSMIIIYLQYNCVYFNEIGVFSIKMDINLGTQEKKCFSCQNKFSYIPGNVSYLFLSTKAFIQEQIILID